MAVTTPREVFEQRMPKTLEAKPDLASKINASYKFVLSGDNGGTWVVDLTQPGGAITEGVERPPKPGTAPARVNVWTLY